jgi:hypothetical protein
VLRSVNSQIPLVINARVPLDERLDKVNGFGCEGDEYTTHANYEYEPSEDEDEVDDKHSLSPFVR